MTKYEPLIVHLSGYIQILFLERLCPALNERLDFGLSWALKHTQENATYLSISWDESAVANAVGDVPAPEEFPWLCGIIDKATGNQIASCVIIPLNNENDAWLTGTIKVVTVASKVEDKRWFRSLVFDIIHLFFRLLYILCVIRTINLFNWPMI